MIGRPKNYVTNLVKLGKLHSISQRTLSTLTSESPLRREDYTGFPPHGVNLGTLYRGTRPNDRKLPRGWAFFEDGSIYVERLGHDHDGLQENMNMAAYFVRNPTSKTIKLPRKDDRQTQMILLE